MRAAIVVESLAKVPAMHLLWEALKKAGLERLECDVVAAVPEDVRDPRPRAIRDGREQLWRGLESHKVVLLLGNTALEAVTDAKGIKTKRGRPFEQDGKLYLPCLTPGNAAYDEKILPMLEADARLFGDMVKRGAIPREENLDWTIVDTRVKFEAMLRDLKGTVSFDIETTGLNPWAKEIVVDGEVKQRAAHVVSIGFGCRDRQWCLPLGHAEFESFGLSSEQMVARIDRKLEECRLCAHNGKFDSLYMRVLYGVRWEVDFDTMLAHWMLDENSRHGLKGLATMYTGAPNYDADKDLKHGDGPLYKHCEYLAHDAYYTRVLRFKFGKLLDREPSVQRAFDLITMPVARLFVDIEFHGVLVDYERFEEVEVHIRGQMKAAEKELRESMAKAGLSHEEIRDMNWRSPQQVAVLFFDKLKIKSPGKKDKKGVVKERSTAESVLKQLNHGVAVALMKFRAADQQLKMFIEGWKPFLVKHADGWRLHPSFKLHGTVTGRASCEHPNLQQVPRDPIIRSLICAPDGWELIEVDLSQIELRLAAEVSGDPTLLGIFQRGEDAHWNTALKEITRGAGMAEQMFTTAKLFVEKYPDTPWLKDMKLDAMVKIAGVKRVATRLVNLDYGTAARIVYRMGPELAAELLPEWKELRKKAKAVNFGYLYGMWWKKMIEYARDNYGVQLTEKQAQESRKSFFDTYRELTPWHNRQKRYARMNGYVMSMSGAKRRLPDALSSDDTPRRAEALRQAINSPIQRFACELNFMAMLELCEEYGPDVARPTGTIHDATLIEVRRDMVPEVTARMLEIMKKPNMLRELGVKLRVPVCGDAKVGPWSKGVSLEKWMKAQALDAAARKVGNKRKVNA